jgi:hypothetical protein
LQDTGFDGCLRQADTLAFTGHAQPLAKLTHGSHSLSTRSFAMCLGGQCLVCRAGHYTIKPSTACQRLVVTRSARFWLSEAGDLEGAAL